jgi:hypothetical protein
MNTNNNEAHDAHEVIDIEEYTKADKHAPLGKKYKVKIDHEYYIFHHHLVTGREILEKAGKVPVECHMLYQKFKHRDPEKVALDEKVDLAKHGVEHFYSKEEHHHYTIIVNAEPHKVVTDHVTYDEVVTFAFPDFPHHPERTYSVKYKKGPSINPEGILSPGGKVKVKNEMTFTVKHTGQS